MAVLCCNRKGEFFSLCGLRDAKAHDYRAIGVIVGLCEKSTTYTINELSAECNDADTSKI